MGKVRVRFFGGLIEATGGRKAIETSASNVSELLSGFITSFGKDFKEKVFDEDDGIRPFVNLYVNNKDIRFLDSLKTQLKDGDCLIMMPAIGGG